VKRYWSVYIVMVKPEGETIFKPYVDRSGCIVAHETRAAARNALRMVRLAFDNAYIQKCGAIS